jgi:hypothetical protein
MHESLKEKEMHDSLKKTKRQHFIFRQYMKHTETETQTLKESHIKKL